MSGAARAFVALGCNVGDRRARLEEALFGLQSTPGIRLAAVSRAYENPPVDVPAGGPPQGDYWNAVAEVVTTLAPPLLLDRLHGLEAAAGRVRAARNDARPLDLDLLSYDDVACSGPNLALPHPMALHRAFVLEPWREIAPGYVVPVQVASVLALAAGLRGTSPASFSDLHPAGILHPRRAAGGGPMDRSDTSSDRHDPGRRPTVLPSREALAAFRKDVRGTLGFVPTMGALHAGHQSLARRARAECDVVVASVFVNPLQFAPTEDLTRYPRTLDADLDLLSREGVDAVYVPSPDDLYPDGFSTSIDIAGISERFEGASRPGHFRGVATVVLKFLLRVRPDRSYFGRKDAQQAAIVRRLAKDLDLPGEIVVCPTVRDVDDLALSSRNRYLSPEERSRALAIPRALSAASDAAARGERDASRLVLVARQVLDRAAGVVVDYVAVADPDTMEPVARIDGPALMLIAAKVGTTRLIDNEWMTVGAERPAPPFHAAPRKAVGA